jgi:hypothetical protein
LGATLGCGEPKLMGMSRGHNLVEFRTKKLAENYAGVEQLSSSQLLSARPYNWSLNQ